MAKQVKIIGVPVSVGYIVDSNDPEPRTSYFGANADSKETARLEVLLNEGWEIGRSDTAVVANHTVLLYTLVKEDKVEED
jgi:hypothetical protein